MTESTVQPFEFRGNPVATVTTGNGTVLFCAISRKELVYGE